MSNDDKNKQLKYVLYARRSIAADKTETDKGVPSILSQQNEVRKLAAEKELRIVKEFTETVSASEPDKRPQFKAMIEFIKAGKANAIICFKVDRLARNPVDEGTLKYLLQKGFIQNIKASDRDWYSDDNVLISAVEFGVANQYTIDLKKHIRRGLSQACARGFRPSIAPIGYKNSKKREKGVDEQIEVDEHNFRLVRRLFDYVLSRQYTAHQILKIASEEWGFRTRKTKKYPHGRKFSKTNMYNILSNTFYYGWFEFPQGSGEWHKGNHKAMITQAEFEEVQRILGRTGARPKRHIFAYTGLMKCAKCGASITCEAKTKHQKNGNVHHYNYYRCTGMLDPNCDNKSIREDRLEEQFIAFLSSIQISPALHDWALEQLQKEYERETLNRESVVYSQQREYRVVSDKLKNLRELAISGAFDPDEYKQEKKKLEAEQRRLQGYLDLVDERLKSWIHDAQRLLTFAERAKEEFVNGGLEKRKAIMTALGTEHVLDQGVVTIKTEKPLLVVQEMVSETESPDDSLEPPKDIAAKGSLGFSDSKFTRMWKCRESNPGAISTFIRIYKV